MYSYLERICQMHSHRILFKPNFTYNNLLKLSEKYNYKPYQNHIICEQNSPEFLAKMLAIWRKDGRVCLIPMHLSEENKLHCKNMIEQSNNNENGLILFTSGTSSLHPKGVCLSHENLLSHIEMLREHIPSTLFSSNDSSFSFLPWTHCYGLMGECMSIIDRGGSMKLYTKPRFHSGFFFRDLHFHSHPTILFAVPKFLQMIEEYDCKYLHLLPLSFRKRCWFGNNIRYIVSGGSFLSNELKLRYWHKFNLPIYQGYGCTEMSPMISLQTSFDPESNDVGILLPNIKVIINEHDNIFVNGPNRFQGYLNEMKIEETEYYNTGDLGYLINNNKLYINGRSKDKVKLLNGKFIDIQEIENYISSFHSLKSEICIWQEKEHFHGVIYDSSKKNDEKIYSYHDNKIILKYISHSFLNTETMNIKGDKRRNVIKKRFRTLFSHFV